MNFTSKHAVRHAVVAAAAGGADPTGEVPTGEDSRAGFNGP
jgi:hypothetical protein